MKRNTKECVQTFKTNNVVEILQGLFSCLFFGLLLGHCVSIKLFASCFNYHAHQLVLGWAFHVGHLNLVFIECRHRVFGCKNS